MIIRAITPSDHDQWQSLWQAYLDFYSVNLEDSITQNVWERIHNPSDPLRCFVAVEGERVIGFTHYFFHGTTWHPTSYCYLEDLFVDATIRSKGAGRALIMAVKEAAQKEGAAKLYWHTDGQNKTAQALYNKVATLTDFIRYDVTL